MFTGSDRQNSVGDDSDMEGIRDKIERRSLSDYAEPMGRFSSSNLPPTPAPTANTLSPPMESLSPPPSEKLHSGSGHALPSRVVRKASKIGINIVSDVRAGSASLFGVIGRKSQQSQILDLDRERVEGLDDMGRPGVRVGRGLSLDRQRWDGDERGSAFGHRLTPCNTHSIMKTRTVSPGPQVQHSKSLSTRTFDPKPSVRFTLDLPPKLDLEFNFSGSSLEDTSGKIGEMKNEERKKPARWAERTTAAVLDKSRFVAAGGGSGDGQNEGEQREVQRKTPPLVDNGEVTALRVVGSQDLPGHRQPRDEAAIGNETNLPVDNQLRHLDPIEPGLTIYRLEDLANMGARVPNDAPSQRESSVYGGILSPALSRQAPSATSSAGNRYVLDPFSPYLF